MVSTATTPNLEALTELRQYPQWVNWRYELREGKQTKVPYRADGKGRASATDPTTWATFEAATEAREHFDGIGYVFDGHHTGVDLDHCRDPQNGSIEPWARAIVDRLNSFTEITPSKTGLHIIIKAKLPPGGNRKGKVEMYSVGRYFTITGDHLAGTPTTIEERQEALSQLHAETFPQPQPRQTAPALTQPVDLADTELIAKAMAAANGAAFSALWNGDTSTHGGDDSAADLALCSHLAFWTGNDAARIDRLFRQSGLYREKWARADYRDRTISKAILHCGNNVYTHSYIGGCHVTNETVTNRDTLGDSERENRDTIVTNRDTLNRDNRDKALQTVTYRDISAEDIRLWVVETDGRYFSTRDLDADLSIRDQKQKDNRRQVLNRMKAAGEVEKPTKASHIFRYVNPDTNAIGIFGAASQPLPLKLPLGIEDYADLYEGNEIVIAGSPNSGKTAFLLNVAAMNVNSFLMPIVYFSSEMAGAELTVRLKKFPNMTEDDWLKIDWRERQVNFQDVVRDQYLNLVDFMELSTEMYLVSDNLTAIQRKVTKGLAIIAIQKPLGRDLGRGAEFSSEKPRLYLSMDPGRIKIVKAKNWHTEGVNPNGLVCKFKLVNGAKFIPDGDWHREEE